MGQPLHWLVNPLPRPGTDKVKSTGSLSATKPEEQGPQSFLRNLSWKWTLSLGTEVGSCEERDLFKSGCDVKGRCWILSCPTFFLCLVDIGKSSHFILLTNPLTPGLIPSWLRVCGVVIAPNEVAFVLVRSGWLFIQKLLGQCMREWHWNGQQFHCREVGMMPAATSGWVEVVDPWLMVLKCDSPISFIIPGPRGRTGTWNQGQDWELSLHWL